MLIQIHEFIWIDSNVTSLQPLVSRPLFIQKSKAHTFIWFSDIYCPIDQAYCQVGALTPPPTSDIRLIGDNPPPAELTNYFCHSRIKIRKSFKCSGRFVKWEGLCGKLYLYLSLIRTAELQNVAGTKPRGISLSFQAWISSYVRTDIFVQQFLYYQGIYFLPSVSIMGVYGTEYLRHKSVCPFSVPQFECCVALWLKIF